jgi:uncharacterized membrane protein
MRGDRLERTVGQVLGLGTGIGIALLAAGIVAMGAAGTGPLSRPFPAFDPGRLAADLRGLQAAGLLWLGLLVVILTPSARVVASFVGFLAEGDRRMAAIAVAIMAAIVASAVIGAGG